MGRRDGPGHGMDRTRKHRTGAAFVRPETLNRFFQRGALADFHQPRRRQGDCYRSSLAKFAFDAEFAAMELYEALGERKAEPRPAMLARIRRLDLFERTQHPVDVFGRNTD